MDKIILAALLTICAASSAAAQNSPTEQEVLKFDSEYQQAALRIDLAFYERVIADDYVYSGANGEVENREEMLAHLRDNLEEPTYKVLSFKSDNERVRISGNMAVVTASWTLTSMLVRVLLPESHTDVGRYTNVYEKRGGRWFIIAEHVSESPHTPTQLEDEVLRASREFNKALNRQDWAAMERQLIDEFIYTDEAGKVRGKADYLSMLKDADLKIESADITERRLRSYGNAAALETGLYTLKGRFGGKPFTENRRYTATWGRRDGRWQLVADHSSLIKRQ